MSMNIRKRWSAALREWRELLSSRLASSPLKKPPGEGTGPTMHADFPGNLVGRVPSRGERDLVQQTARKSWLFIFHRPLKVGDCFDQEIGWLWRRNSSGLAARASTISKTSR